MQDRRGLWVRIGMYPLQLPGTVLTLQHLRRDVRSDGGHQRLSGRAGLRPVLWRPDQLRLPVGRDAGSRRWRVQGHARVSGWPYLRSAGRYIPVPAHLPGRRPAIASLAAAVSRCRTTARMGPASRALATLPRPAIRWCRRAASRGRTASSTAWGIRPLLTCIAAGTVEVGRICSPDAPCVAEQPLPRTQLRRRPEPELLRPALQDRCRLRRWYGSLSDEPLRQRPHSLRFLHHRVRSPGNCQHGLPGRDPVRAVSRRVDQLLLPRPVPTRADGAARTSVVELQRGLGWLAKTVREDLRPWCRLDAPPPVPPPHLHPSSPTGVYGSCSPDPLRHEP